MSRSKNIREINKKCVDSNYMLTSREFLISSNPTMPDDLLKFILSWKQIKKSPYNNVSYYNGVKDWKSFVHGGIRVSDHWNFFARGEIHCITNQKIENNVKWWVGVYDEKTQIYDLIASYPKVDRKRSFLTKALIKPSTEIIDKGKKFKADVKDGKVFVQLNDKICQVVKHGFHYGKRFIKVENQEEKLFIDNNQEFVIL